MMILNFLLKCLLLVGQKVFLRGASVISLTERQMENYINLTIIKSVLRLTFQYYYRMLLYAIQDSCICGQDYTTMSRAICCILNVKYLNVDQVK